MRYFVRIYRCIANYSAMVPDLLGCVATACSVEKVRRLIGEAIGLHIDLMRQSGETIPPPSQRLDFTMDETSEKEFCTWVEARSPEPVSS